MPPSTPRILIALLAVAAVAVPAAGVPFDDPGQPGDPTRPTPEDRSQTPEPSDGEPFALAALAGLARYLLAGALGLIALAAGLVIYRGLSAPAAQRPGSASARDRDAPGPEPADLGAVADAAGRAAESS